MRLYLLILLIALPCIILYLLYGRAYLWAYRSARWGDLDAAAPGGGPEATAGPAPLAARRKATRSERRALGMPMRSAILTVAVILSAFASIALLAPQDPDLAVFGVVACGILAGCAALFVWLDRVPAAGEVRGMRGVLSAPDGAHAYVPVGGMLVGGVPVLYPVHWQPLIQSDVGQAVDIELTEQGAVLRHGEHLSLDQETRRFDYRPWQPTGVIAAALVVLAVASLFFYAPLGQRLEAARDALDGHRLVQIRDQAQWLAWQPVAGDEVQVSGITGDCMWTGTSARGAGGPGSASVSASGSAATLHDCREVVVDLPGDKPAMPVLGARQQTAAQLSLALEQMLQTRRNATPEEVREHWRLAGQGSSQRWTLVALADTVAAVDALCGAGTCEARDLLVQVQAAAPARSARPAPDALVMDAASAQRLAQAGFALAAETLDPIIAQALQAAQARHAQGKRRLVSQDGQPLADAGTAMPLADSRDQALVQSVGDQSPRLRMLRVAQALDTSGEHPISFSGAVRVVQADAASRRVEVDTRVQPLPAWMKLAPVIAWLLLTILAVGAVVLAVVHRRRQQLQLAAIDRHYAAQQA